jgi:hypothetical protein
MSTTGGVGQGVTLSLSVDTVIARVRNVQMPEWITDAVDFSGLNNLDWMQFIAGGLADPGAFVAELFFDTEIALPTIREVQVATFTFPVQTAGNSTLASLTGSGFLISVGWPNAAIAEPMLQSLTFKYDGVGTAPAFTLETT